MNELRLLLETVHRTLELKTALETYRAEKYESLTRTWVVSEVVQQISPKPDPESPAVAQHQKFQKELENVDNLLQKAKLIREKGDGVSLKPTSSSASMKPKPCQQCIKGTCKRHKTATEPIGKSASRPTSNTGGNVNARPKSGLASQRQLSGKVRGATIGNTRTGNKSNRKAKPAIDLKPQEISEANAATKTSQSETVVSKHVSEKMTVTKSLYEVVQENSSKLSRFRKLQSMHSKIKSQCSEVTSTPCKEETDFISKLYGSKHPVLVISNDAAFKELKVITHQVHNLEQILSQKDLVTKHHDKGSRLYMERKLYRNASDIFRGITKNFQTLVDANIVCLSPMGAVNHIDANEVLLSPFMLSFRHEKENVALCRAKYDLIWNSLWVKIKEEMYEVLTQLLDKTPGYLDKDDVGIQDINQDYSTLVKHAFNLLAQSHSYSVPPTLVWDG